MRRNCGGPICHRLRPQGGTAGKVNDDQAETIQRLHADSKSVAAIARTVGLSRPTIYKILSTLKESVF